MDPKYYWRIAGVLVLLIVAHVAWYQLENQMDRPPTVPDNVQIVDGDRLMLDGQAMHLYGIDAPELGQVCSRAGKNYACGRQAKSQLEQLFINSGSVVCEQRGEPEDGWLPAICKVDGRDVNGEMVRLGQALAYRDEAFYYSDHEKEAQEAGRGLWGSKFDPPWEWRARAN
ncbi:MAG: thermonuclease family protein [Kiloniellales bacterium]|nr:thermonuclease family protein [Kiloniellales bacterium]